MSANDLRDVFNLPTDGVTRPKKTKVAVPRQNLKGLAREVQSLGGNNPISVVPPFPHFKKRKLSSRVPAGTWELVPFKNSARQDSSLVLRHWKRVTKPADPPLQESDNASATDTPKPEELEDSQFAKFNVQIPVPRYTHEQYYSSLQCEDWTKDETDYLIELARQYDLRWSIIWDRWDYKVPPADMPHATALGISYRSIDRDIDSLKARYYEVAAKMMATETPVKDMTPKQQHLHSLMMNFNTQQERMRRSYVVDSLSRTPEQVKNEENLLIEVKRIMARNEQMNEHRRELLARLDYPLTGDNVDMTSLRTSAGLHQLIQTLMLSDKTKKKKAITESVNMASPSALTPGAESVAGPALNGRKDSNASGRVDSLGGDSALATPTTVRGHGRKSSVAAQATTGAVAPQERRTLNKIEEAVYGVSYFERLSSGAQFRYERVTKLFTHKSTLQTHRVTNILTELGVPPRLRMPTSDVVTQFEGLVASINVLLDLRKLNDKLDAEVRTEKAKIQLRLEPSATQQLVSSENNTGNSEGGGASVEIEPAVVAASGRAVSQRPDSGGIHKRSASDLSAPDNDKASKKQRK